MHAYMNSVRKSMELTLLGDKVGSDVGFAVGDSVGSAEGLSVGF